MSFIAKNPLTISEINDAPSVPKGMRGLIAKEDGWYDVDSGSNVRKFVTGGDVGDTVFPEMFGAIGDGEADDSEAIQAAIDTRKPVKFMSKTYKISKTLNLVGSSGFNFQGLYLDGNNCTIMTTANEPIFLLTLCGNQLANFTLTYDKNVFNKVNNPYTSDVVKIMSYGKRAVRNNNGEIIRDAEGKVAEWYEIGKNSGRHRLTNINIQSPLRWNEDASTMHYGNGFTIVAEGHLAYSYQNIFIGCQVEAMHVAINLVRSLEEEERSFGINGNQFDVTSWVCDKYLEGNPGGCYFSGCVQCSDLKKDNNENILNQYLIEETDSGMGNNVFDNYFYDIAWDNSSAKRRQKLIDIKGYTNHFTSYVPPISVDGNYFNNEFHFTGANNKQVLLPTTGYGTAILNQTNIIPFSNSFSTIVKDDNHTIEFFNIVGYKNNNVEKYKIKNLKTYLPTKITYLFGDNSANRGLYLTPTSADNSMVITIRDFGTVFMGNMFLHFMNNPDKNPINICKLELTDTSGNITTVNGDILQKTRMLISLVNNSMTAYKEMKLTISFNYDGNEGANNTFLLSKISGCVFSATNGLLESTGDSTSGSALSDGGSASNDITARNAVRINNLSSIPHELIIKARGKNHVNIEKSKILSFADVKSGYKFVSLGNNSFKSVKTEEAVSEDYNWDRFGFVIGTKKELYGKTITVSVGSKGDYNAEGELLSDDIGSYIQIYSVPRDEGAVNGSPYVRTAVSRSGYDSITFTVNDDYIHDYVAVLFGTGTYEINAYRKFENIMVEIGDSASPYVDPINDISAVEIRKYRRNLVSSDVYNEEKWIANRENGYLYRLENLQFESLSLNAKASEEFTDEKLYFVHSLDNGATWEITDDTEYKLVDNDSVIGISVVPTENAVYALWTKNLSLLKKITDIMMEIGDPSSAYDEYLEPVIYKPDKNGRVLGVTNNIYPSMTIVSNTNNVIFDIEYMTSNYREVDNSMAANNTDNGGNINTIIGSAIGVDMVLNFENIYADEHELEVVISGQDGVDLSTVSISRCGKNIFNYHGDDWGDAKKVVESGGERNRFLLFLDDLPNETLSLTCKVNNPSGHLRLYTYSSSMVDGVEKYTMETLLCTFLNSGKISEEACTFIKESGKRYCLWATVKNDITQFQVELGDTPTEYEPYTEIVSAANTDGIVKGLTSLYPAMALFSNTDGITINAKYLTTSYEIIDNYISKKIQALLSGNNE